MGNTSPLSTGANITISFNGTAVPGSSLNGTIKLSVTKPRVDCEQLRLKFQGREHTTVVYYVTVGSGKNRHRERRHAHAQAVLLDTDYVVASFPAGCVTQGEYEFPFNLEIPAGLPGCQKMSLGGDDFVIEYSLEARLHRNGMFKWDVVNAVRVHVEHAKRYCPPTPTMITPEARDVTFMCCLNSGQMTLGAALSSNNVGVGQAIAVNYVIENNSTSRVKALEVVVNTYVTVTAGHHVGHMNHVLYSNRIESNMPPPQNAPTKQPSAGAVSDEHTNKQRMWINMIMSGDCPKLVIPIPAGNILQDYNGRLIRISHGFQISLKTPFGVDNINLACPFYVHAGSIAGPQQMAIVPQQQQQQQYMAGPPGVHLAAAVPTRPDYGLTNGDEPINHNLLMESSMMTANQVVMSNPPDSVAYVLQAMDYSYDDSVVLRNWLPGANKAALTPQAFFEIFRRLQTWVHRIEGAEMLAVGVPNLTCMHAVAAVKGCGDPSCQNDILRQFGPKCIDKHNHKLILKQELGMNDFSLMVIEYSFQ